MIVARASELDLRRVLSRDEAIIAVGEGELRGDSLACALHSDLLVLAADTRIFVDTPTAWSGIVWRMGRGALMLCVAPAILPAAIADLLVPALRDPLQWTAEWVGTRSAIALDAAANLIRRNGGDILERAEFARLFAAGEPQKGLAAWLESRSTKRKKL
ncbi:MAG TPA: hypothetical protein VHU41_13330 [Thermoanaerobaculia bacterium]|jgi:hypothetical protein|nr:hypothetical protein [Thermoanaerobaculia bacterium]